MVAASGTRGAFRSGDLCFDGPTPCLNGECDLKDALLRAYEVTGEDEPIVLLDVDGFQSDFLNSEVVKEIRLKKRDLLFVTYVRDSEDVIGALTGAFSGLGIPVNTVRDEDVLTDALDLSEYVFPVAFSKDGREISGGEGVYRIADRMKKLGFQRMMVIDTDHLSAEMMSFSEPEKLEAKDSTSDA